MYQTPCIILFLISTICIWIGKFTEVAYTDFVSLSNFIRHIDKQNLIVCSRCQLTTRHKTTFFSGGFFLYVGCQKHYFSPQIIRETSVPHPLSPPAQKNK